MGMLSPAPVTDNATAWHEALIRAGQKVFDHGVEKEDGDEHFNRHFGFEFNCDLA